MHRQVLVSSAGDQHQWLVVRLYRGDRAFWCSGDRIVDERHAVDLPDGLQPMRHSMKPANGCAHCVAFDARGVRGSGGGQNVGQVVPSPQRHLRSGQQRLAQQHQAFVSARGEIGAFDHALETEAQHTRLWSVAQAPGVVSVEHGPVRRLLVRQDLPLGRPVRLHAGMAVEMIRGHVGDQPDVRTDLQRLELEAGQLHDDPARRAHLVQLAEQRTADVAADEHVAARRLEHAPEQACGGALASAACDPEDRRWAQREEQLDEAGDAQAACAGRLQQGVLGRHAWRGVDHVNSLEIGRLMSTQA